MKKQAFINGRVLTPEQDKFETLNLLLINGIVTGQGYIPDDDDSEVINIAKHILLPINPDKSDAFKALSDDEKKEALSTTPQEWVVMKRPSFPFNKKASFIIFSTQNKTAATLEDASWESLECKYIIEDGKQITL